MAEGGWYGIEECPTRRPTNSHHLKVHCTLVSTCKKVITLIRGGNPYKAIKGGGLLGSHVL